MCEYLRKIAVCGLIKNIFYGIRVLFNSFRASLGKCGQKWGLKCFGLKKFPQHEKKSSRFLFFQRLFSLEYFSCKFGEIWAKILRSPKNLPGPTPTVRYLR